MNYTVSPVGLRDAPSICDLMNAVEAAEIGGGEFDLHEVERLLSQPSVSLEHGSWLFRDSQEPVAFGLVRGKTGGTAADTVADCYVLPGHARAAERLLTLIEAGAVQRARAAGAQEALLRMNLTLGSTVDKALLSGRGWRTARRYQVLTRELTAADAVPEPPAGTVLRNCRDEAVRHRAHALVEETFAGHFGFVPRTFQEWLEDMGGAEAVDWSLVWVVEVAEEGDAAVLVTRDDLAGMGWVRNIGVRAAHRRRGLGGHLLRHAFGAYAARGRDLIGLGVDTANADGALDLYLRHGMSPHFAMDTWELALTAGPA